MEPRSVSWIELLRSVESKIEREDFYGTIADISKAIELKPTSATTYCSRGIAKYNLKDYHGAITDYTKAIDINPDYAEALGSRGIAQMDLGKKRAARKDFVKVKQMGLTVPRIFTEKCK